MGSALPSNRPVESDRLLGADEAGRLLSVEHAAGALQLPVDVVRRALEKGALRGTRGPVERISQQSVDAFLAARAAVHEATDLPEAA